MVVMPEYLKTSSKQNTSKPRIISEVRKNCLSKLKLGFTTSLQDYEKSKFSGQLLWKKGNSEWALKMAEVRNGSLILMSKETTAVELRLPLRELHLRSCNAPKTFCLAEAKGLRLSMFQALTEEDYEKWVRIIAVELIRQTPLQNVRFLDILSIIRHKESRENAELRRGRSEECLTKVEEFIWDNSKCLHRSSLQNDSLTPNDPKKFNRIDVVDAPKRDSNNFSKTKITIQNSMPIISETGNKKIERKWLRTQSMNNLSENPRETRETSDESGISSGDEIQGDPTPRITDDLSFVPVKERKKFFESLNSGRKSDFGTTKESPLSRSNSIGNVKNSVFDRFMLRKRKRTKSLHDLHKTPVKEMCQFFESMEESEKFGSTSPTEKRFQRGERKLDKLWNQIADVESNINVIAKDLKSLGRKNMERQEGINAHVALQRRLDEENSKLERLMEETARIIKGNQIIIMNVERCNNEQYSQ